MTTGSCYCGAVQIRAKATPQTVAYCHCNDCRRVSGAPVSAFAVFARDEVHMTPDQGRPVSHAEGVERWFCKDCGSPLAAQYDYLPDQIYIPIGLLDQAAELGPELHAHTGSRLPWLHLDDDLTKIDASSRAALQEKSSHS